MIQISRLNTVSYLLLENRFDIVLREENRSVLLHYLVRGLSSLNKSYTVMYKVSQLKVFPFCFSLQFILALAICQGYAEQAVEIWMELMACQCDFINGM